MEILTTGEKIKRARVYLNLTLKELCQSEISMSKMSCIENNKIEAEEWILRLVSDRLQVPFNYLNETAEEQIKNNIEAIKKSPKDSNYEESIKYNMDYAESMQAYKLCLELMHLLYNYYLEVDKLENIEVLNFRYYDLYQKSCNEEEKVNYFMDKGRYLCRRKEYIQADTYFENLRTEIMDKEELTKQDYNNYIRVSCYSIYCKEQLGQYEDAYEKAMDVVKHLDKADDEEYKANIYQILSVICLTLDKDEFPVYRDKYLNSAKVENIDKSHTILKYGEISIKKGEIAEGKEYINHAISQFPSDDNRERTKFMLYCLELFVKYEFIEEAQEICDEVVNESISLDDVKFIEKAYYFKSIILQKKDSYISAEMYMNLSLDALRKFGGRNELYKRYMEMGKMYYKMHEVAESIKYFDLAMKLEKKI